MKAKHRKILIAIFTGPANGNMEWSKIEFLQGAIDCRSIEGARSSVIFKKNGMNYSGYFANVEFDAEDHIFVERIIGIRDVIGFHGESVTKLETAFMKQLTIF